MLALEILICECKRMGPETSEAVRGREQSTQSITMNQKVQRENPELRAHPKTLRNTTWMRRRLLGGSLKVGVLVIAVHAAFRRLHPGRVLPPLHHHLRARPTRLEAGEFMSHDVGFDTCPSHFIPECTEPLETGGAVDLAVLRRMTFLRHSRDNPDHVHLQRLDDRNNRTSIESRLRDTSR